MLSRGTEEDPETREAEGMREVQSGWNVEGGLNHCLHPSCVLSLVNLILCPPSFFPKAADPPPEKNIQSH